MNVGRLILALDVHFVRTSYLKLFITNGGGW